MVEARDVGTATRPVNSAASLPIAQYQSTGAAKHTVKQGAEAFTMAARF